MRISDWSSDVCSSDLPRGVLFTVMLDPTTGEYTVTLEDNVLHADDGTDTENDATTDITFTAIDSEGDPTDAPLTITDRKSVVYGQSVSVDVDLGCRSHIQTKKN